MAKVINCNVYNVSIRQSYRETRRTADHHYSDKTRVPMCPPDVFKNLQEPWWKNEKTSYSKKLESAVHEDEMLCSLQYLK